MSNSTISTLILPNKKKYSEPFKKYVFTYNKDQHYLHVTHENDQPIYYETPFLQVYRNLHQHLDKYYLVLEISSEIEQDDVTKEVYNFKTMLDKIYGHSHEFIRKNFQTIFPKAQGHVDKYTYDTCIIRPFAGSNGQFIKILIPDEELAKRAYELKYEEEVKCLFIYNGLLKMKGGKLMEEYVLVDIYTDSQRTQDILKRSISEHGTKYEVEIIKEEKLIEENQNNYEVHFEDKQHEQQKHQEHQEHQEQQQHKYQEQHKQQEHQEQDEQKKVEKINNEELMDNVEVQSIIEQNLDYQKEMENVENMIFENQNENINVKNEEEIEYMNGAEENKEKIKDKKNKKEKNKKKELKESKSERKKEKENDKKKKDMKKKMSKQLKKTKSKSESSSEYESSENDDNLSDNEEFSKLSDDMKKMIRKFR